MDRTFESMQSMMSRICVLENELREITSQTQSSEYNELKDESIDPIASNFTNRDDNLSKLRGMLSMQIESSESFRMNTERTLNKIKEEFEMIVSEFDDIKKMDSYRFSTNKKFSEKFGNFNSNMQNMRLNLSNFNTINLSSMGGAKNNNVVGTGQQAAHINNEKNVSSNNQISNNLGISNKISNISDKIKEISVIKNDRYDKDKLKSPNTYRNDRFSDNNFNKGKTKNIGTGGGNVASNIGSTNNLQGIPGKGGAKPIFNINLNSLTINNNVSNNTNVNYVSSTRSNLDKEERSE